MGVPAALDNVEQLSLTVAGIDLDTNFITASTAGVVEVFSFVFVAYISEDEESFLIGVSVVQLC